MDKSAVVKFLTGTGVSLATMAKDAEMSNLERLTRIRQNWRFYKGTHWDVPRANNDPYVTINFIRRIIDLNTMFMFKDGFKVTIPDDPATAEDEGAGEREFVRAALEEQWRRNGGALLGMEMGQMGAVTGDAFVKTSWDDEEELEEGGYVRLDVLPSQFVFPSFGGPHGVDRKKLDHVLVLFPRYKSTGNRPAGDFELAKNLGNISLYAEDWYPDKVMTYDDSTDPSVKPNPLGEIPIVHIANFVLAGEYFGQSDIDDLIDVNAEFNAKTTDVSDVVNYHGSPTTIVEGARVSEIQKGANKVWSIPEGAKAYNLELVGDLGASMNYVKLLKDLILELSGVPESLMSGGSNSESGVALALKFLSMTSRRDTKLLSYRQGIRYLHRLMLKILALKDNEFAQKFLLLKKNKYRTDASFPDALPRDEAIELDKSLKRVEGKLSSRRREMTKMGLSQGEIVQVEDEIEDEMATDADVEFTLGQKFSTEPPKQERSGNPNPIRPDPDVQAEHRSMTAERDGR